MTFDIIFEVMIPFLGTILGAACVYLFKNSMHKGIQKAFGGFAAGVMVAASVWSLLIPSVEYSSGEGIIKVLPAIIGLWMGFLFLMFLDKVIPHVHIDSKECEGVSCNLKGSTKMILAVALHNLPEGMAVGVAIAGALASQSVVTTTASLALAIGIAIQNFPEGAIVSLPLKEEGMSKHKAFLIGALSGIVEPLGAFTTMLIAGVVIPALPYFLSFAAGAMLFVVVEELIPQMAEGKHSHLGTIFFAIGFTAMMVLDLLLG